MPLADDLAGVVKTKVPDAITPPTHTLPVEEHDCEGAECPLFGQLVGDDSMTLVVAAEASREPLPEVCAASWAVTVGRPARFARLTTRSRTA